MVRLTKAQRMVLVSAFPAAGNLAAGALVFGQALSGNGYSVPLATTGFLIWALLLALALLFAASKDLT